MDDLTQCNEDPLPLNNYFKKRKKENYMLLMKEIKDKSERDKYRILMHTYRI